MVTLDELLDRGDARERARTAGRSTIEAIGAGLYWTGWLLFRVVRLVLLVIGGVFYGIGWTAGRLVWPALKWSAAAIKLGWADSQRGGRRVAG